MAEPPREIPETEAGEALRALYRDIQHTLRLSFTPQLFRALAVQERLFSHLWRALRPTITVYLERSTDELRAMTVDRVVQAADGSDQRARLREHGYADDEIGAIVAQLQVHHYIAPKLLLITHELQAALEGSSTSVQSRVLWPQGRGVPPGMPRVEPIDPGRAEGTVAEIFADLRTTLDLPTVGDGFRALAHWPDVLEWAWSDLRDWARREGYRNLLEELRHEAQERARVLPRRLRDLAPDTLERRGLGEEEREQATQTVELCARLLTTETIHMARLASALLGAEEARWPSAVLLRRWAVPRGTASV